MNYQNHYDLLVFRGKSRLLEGYSEKHHIIPKCMGGDDMEYNLVRLTPEEHYLAHQLLVKIYPDNHNLIFAANMMSVDRHGYRVNNKSYGWIRKKHAVAASNALLGRTKDTHEYLRMIGEKVSKTQTGRTKENNESVRRMSATKSGRTKETHNYIERISNKKSGRTKETNKGVFQQSLKMTGRTKETCSGIKSRSEKMIGRTKENHEGVSSGALKRKKLTSELENCLCEMKYSGIKNEEIQKFFSELGLNICRMTIYNIFNRQKKFNACIQEVVND